MQKINRDGYEIIQADNNHIWICKDGEMLMHISCTKELTKKELAEQLDFYFKMHKYSQEYLSKVSDDSE